MGKEKSFTDLFSGGKENGALSDGNARSFSSLFSGESKGLLDTSQVLQDQVNPNLPSTAPYFPTFWDWPD